MPHTSGGTTILQPGGIDFGLNKLFETFGTGGSRDRERQAQQEREEKAAAAAKAQGLVDILSGGDGVKVDPTPVIDERAQTEALGQITQLEPQFGTVIGQALAEDNQLGLEQIRLASVEGAELARTIQKLPTHAEKVKAITDNVAKQQAEGTATPESIQRSIDLVNLSEEQLDLELQKMDVLGTAVERAIPPQTGLFSTPEKRRAFAQLALSNPKVAEQIRKGEETRLRAQEGFTLRPGETRFGPQGREIARVAPKEKDISTQAFLNLQSGKVENLTDQQAADSQNQVVPLTALKDMGLSRDAQGGLSLQFTPPKSATQRDQKIESLTQQLLPSLGDRARTEATNVIDGLKRIVTSEDGSKVSLIDDTAILRGAPDEAVTEIQIKELDAPERVEIPASQGLFQEAGQATGIISGAAATGANIAGLVGVDIQEPFTEIRQKLNIVSNDLIRALSINPRFPVGEINRIKEEVNIQPSLIKSSATLRKKMRALDSSLRIRVAQAKRDASDQRLPKQVRESQAANASSIENFLNQMNVPQRIEPGEIQTVEDVDALSNEQVINLLDDQNSFKSLPMAARREMTRRVRNR